MSTSLHCVVYCLIIFHATQRLQWSSVHLEVVSPVVDEPLHNMVHKKEFGNIVFYRKQVIIL